MSEKKTAFLKKSNINDVIYNAKHTKNNSYFSLKQNIFMIPILERKWKIKNLQQFLLSCFVEILNVALSKS